MNQLEEKTKMVAKQQVAQAHAKRQLMAPQVGKLLLYVDNALEDTAPVGSVRRQAFNIMPKEVRLLTGKRLSENPISPLSLRWQAINKQAGTCTKNLRPTAMTVDFDSTVVNNP